MNISTIWDPFTFYSFTRVTHSPILPPPRHGRHLREPCSARRGRAGPPFRRRRGGRPPLGPWERKNGCFRQIPPGVYLHSFPLGCCPCGLVWHLCNSYTIPFTSCSLAIQSEHHPDFPLRWVPGASVLGMCARVCVFLGKTQ